MISLGMIWVKKLRFFYADLLGDTKPPCPRLAASASRVERRKHVRRTRPQASYLQLKRCLVVAHTEIKPPLAVLITATICYGPVPPIR